ncbi:hypothetical protein HanIR_Chr04g0174781 [Helianthus annuus]|nr:hypothetical protein HanIR_Chr04g0174781 [Helianthus annuus]
MSQRIVCLRKRCEFLDLLCIAFMPILKVLIVTTLGSFLALDFINLIGEHKEASQ